MKNTTLIVIILLCLCCSSDSNAQIYGSFIRDSITRLNSYDSIIIWNNNRKLMPDDFQGIPDTKSNGNAAASCHIFPVYTVDSPFQFCAISCFNKKKSWIRKGISDTNTMIHEQGHFDISEIYARKMNAELGKLKYVKDSMNWKVYYVHLKFLDEVIALQNKYDKETNHSVNKAKQAAWNKKIKKMLKGPNKKL